MIRKTWQSLSHLGIPHTASLKVRRHQTLANQMAIVFLLLGFMVSFVFLLALNAGIVLGAILLLLVSLSVLGLHAMEQPLAGKWLLATGTSLSVLVPLIANFLEPTNYLAFSYTTIIWTMPPMFIFRAEERRSQMITLVFTLAIVLGFDPLVAYLHPEAQPDYFKTNYLAYKIPQLSVIGVALFSLYVYKRISQRYEETLHARNNRYQRKIDELKQLTMELSQQKEEIETQREQLESNKDRLFKFLEQIPVGIYIVNAEGKPYYANKYAIEMLGDKIMQDNGLKLPERIAAKVADTEVDYPTNRLPLLQALWYGMPSQVDDLEIQRSGKKNLPLEVTAGPIYNEDDEIEFAIAVYQDVTERHEYEAELLHKKSQLAHSLEDLKITKDILAKKEAESRSLLEAIDLNFISAQLDTEGKVLHVNQLALNYMEVERESLVGHYNDKFDPSANSLDEEIRISYRDFWRQLRIGHTQSKELKIQLPKDQLWLHATYMPITDASGQVEKILLLGHDITARMEQQAEIEDITTQLEEKYEEIEQQHTRLEVQQNEIQAKNRQLNTQHDLLEAKNEELQETNQQLEEVVRKLKEAQSQLVQSEKMAALGQLTAGIAHELNNPINYVLSGIEGLRDATEMILHIVGLYEDIEPENADAKVKDIASYKEKIRFKRIVELFRKTPENIGMGASRAAEIVKELRTFSRLNEADLKQAEVHDGLDSTLVLLSNQYKKDIRIVKNYGEIPDIECYPGKLNQVFMNLMTNAIQAIREKRKQQKGNAPKQDDDHISIITALVEKEGQPHVSIAIADTGLGIPREIIGKIFDPFFTTKDVGKGTGLGLSISSSIIRDHDGTINVESRPNEGTTFTILLPLKQNTLNRP